MKKIDLIKFIHHYNKIQIAPLSFGKSVAGCIACIVRRYNVILYDSYFIQTTQKETLYVRQAI